MLFCLALLLPAYPGYSQTDPNSGLTAEGFLLKSETQKKTGRLLLVGGLLLSFSGTLLEYQNAQNDPVYYVFNELRTGSVITILGVGAVLSSIPGYISAAKNKRRAMILSFGTSRVKTPNHFQSGLGLQPTFTVKIVLNQGSH